MLGPCATPLLRYPRKAAVGHHEPRARNHRRTLSHRGRHPRKTARRTIGGSPGAGRAHRDGLICLAERTADDRLEEVRDPARHQLCREPVAGTRAITRRRTTPDRKSVVEGKSASERVDLGGRRINKKK